MPRLNSDTLIAILLLLFCGVLMVSSFQIREPDYGQLSPATWPRIIIVAMTVLSFLYLVQSIRQPAPLAPTEKTGRDGEPFFSYWRNVIWCFVLFFAYLMAMPWLGMLVGGVLFVFMLLNALGGWTPRLLLLHAAVALLTVGGMWSLFTYALGVMLPTGELTGGFR